MSTLKAEVVRVEILPHPNADRLEIAKVRGWQCVTGKGQYATGDLVVYLPIDSVLPEKLVKKLEIEKNYHNRLKTIKLRGFVSQGMVMPLPTSDWCASDAAPLPEEWHEGDDVTHILGITKYEPPPPPVNMSGISRQAEDRFQRYTQVENIKNYPNLFKQGDWVILSEKLHGTNFRAANINGEIHVGSHNMDLVENPDNLYWKAANLLDVKNRLKPGEQIFGEIYGAGIQKNFDYGKKQGELGISIFDVLVDNQYLNHIDYMRFILDRELESYAVPMITLGEWNDEMMAYSKGPSLLYPSNIREGFVVKPIIEKYSEELGGRLILKSISEDYLLMKDGTDYH